eukprot:2577725-Rhodomonas_salina.1
MFIAHLCLAIANARPFIVEILDDRSAVTTGAISAEVQGLGCGKDCCRWGLLLPGCIEGVVRDLTQRQPAGSSIRCRAAKRGCRRSAGGSAHHVLGVQLCGLGGLCVHEIDRVARSATRAIERDGQGSGFAAMRMGRRFRGAGDTFPARHCEFNCSRAAKACLAI